MHRLTFSDSESPWEWDVENKKEKQIRSHSQMRITAHVYGGLLAARRRELEVFHLSSVVRAGLAALQ